MIEMLVSHQDRVEPVERARIYEAGDDAWPAVHEHGGLTNLYEVSGGGAKCGRSAGTTSDDRELRGQVLVPFE